MDYLNYGKQVQQQPQKPQSQGFGNQVQLTKDDFTFGDLNQQTPQPQAAPQTKDGLIQLFPNPVLICSCPFEYSKELEWIKKQPSRKIINEKGSNVEDQLYIRSNRKYLNRQSEDTYLLDRPELSRVRQFIESKLKEYVVNLMGSDSEMVITQSWHNMNGKGESHHEHSHPNSMVSGVWYPQIYESSPPIQFRKQHQRDVELSIAKYNNFNSSTFLIPMKAGELILFPSDLPHSVPINQSDQERISLSFNTWTKGSMGSERSLTYVPFDKLM